MEKIQDSYNHILGKLRACLINDFLLYENDPNRIEVHEETLEACWKECSKAIDVLNGDIHLHDRIELVKKEMEKLGCMDGFDRTPRFFDDQEKSVNSMKIDYKRAYAQFLSQADHDYEQMMKSMMNMLVEKKAELKLDENHFTPH